MDAYPLPGGLYASRIAPPSRFEPNGPVVQVLQSINGEWHPTPARHYASTLVEAPPGSVLAIDFGQGWSLNLLESVAHRAFAAGVLAATPE
jgi:hypothetical protein